MRTAILCAFSAAAAICVAAAQPAPAFDVASVKPSSSEFNDAGTGRKGPPPFSTEPTRLAARGLTLKKLIAHAYGLDDSLVSGGPAWTEDDCYDVDARTESPASKEQMLLMLRTLLADRFALKFHRETKSVPEYVLVVAKNGPRYGPHLQPTQQGSAPPPSGQIPLKNKTMKDLAFFLSDNRQNWDPGAGDGPAPPVLDRTGLTGAYDIFLTFAPSRDFLSVFEQELGLKLELRKIPSELFIIDAATRQVR
jgi:uncharacterized protein (TIGR03435 family)